MVQLLHAVRNYPDVMTRFGGSFYMHILIRAARHLDSSESSLGTVNDRLCIQEWLNLRASLNDIDGNPCFYEFALKLSIYTRKVGSSWRKWAFWGDANCSRGGSGGCIYLLFSWYVHVLSCFNYVWIPSLKTIQMVSILRRGIGDIEENASTPYNNWNKDIS